MFLQIILHEAGHLVFGILSGYRFTSFRIGSFMWVNEKSCELLNQFEKCAESYPYPNEMEGERELLRVVEECQCLVKSKYI